MVLEVLSFVCLGCRGFDMLEPVDLSGFLQVPQYGSNKGSSS